MVETIRIGELSVLRASPPSGSRRPVLFVHGIFVDGSVWANWLSLFAARGVPGYAVHLRGRAGSRPGANLGRTSIDDFADDASTVARHVGAVAVVGHSMGGLIAQKIAERGDVDAAVLVTPAPPRGITVLTPRVAMLQLKYLPSILLARPMYPGREDIRELVLNRIPPHQQDNFLDLLLPDSGRAARDMSITGVPVDARRVTCPMLVIAAEDDRFIPAAVVGRIAARYHAPLVTASHHGHMVIVEPNWEEIADRVEVWIREHT